MGGGWSPWPRSISNYQRKKRRRGRRNLRTSPHSWRVSWLKRLRRWLSLPDFVFILLLHPSGRCGTDQGPGSLRQLYSGLFDSQRAPGDQPQPPYCVDPIEGWGSQGGQGPGALLLERFWLLAWGSPDTLQANPSSDHGCLITHKDAVTAEEPSIAVPGSVPAWVCQGCFISPLEAWALYVVSLRLLQKGWPWPTPLPLLMSSVLFLLSCVSKAGKSPP